MNDDSQTGSEAVSRRWRALERNERRVAGVLAEKAKTTPENYPLSLNSLISGCNQKSNRSPQMQLDEEQVSDALDSLRHAGAVVLIQGDGRVEKFRHLLYEWLGVDKAELAVMTELLLRGAQTLGELRGRAARMEPIADIGALQPIVDSLRRKELLVLLTPPGRGAVVTHNLYQPQELAKVRSELGGGGADESAPDSPPRAERIAVGGDDAAAARQSPEAQELRAEMAALRRELAEVRRDVDDLRGR